MSPWAIILWLLGLLAALFALSYLVARIVVRPPRFITRRTPADYGLQADRIEFPSLDGLTMRGWWIPGNSSHTVILCHGFGGTHGMMLRYAALLQPAGFNTLTFDFRAHGQSDGTTTTIGFHEVADLMGAVRYVRQRSDGKIGVYGISMGGAVALRAAAVCPDIAAVATEGAYARLTWAAINYLTGFTGPLGLLIWPFVLLFAQNIGGIRARLCAPVELIAKISPRPVFLIHGQWDTLVWPFHARRLYEAAREPKCLWMVQRAWHGGAYKTVPQEFQRRLTQFFAASLGAEGNEKPESPAPNELVAAKQKVSQSTN